MNKQVQDLMQDIINESARRNEERAKEYAEAKRIAEEKGICICEAENERAGIAHYKKCSMEYCRTTEAWHRALIISNHLSSIIEGSWSADKPPTNENIDKIFKHLDMIRESLTGFNPEVSAAAHQKDMLRHSVEGGRRN